MRITIHSLILVSLFTVSAFAQIPKPSEVGLSYTYVHTNAPPAGCGCFSMHGASGSTAFDLSHNFALVGEVAFQHASNILGSSKGLTLFSYAAGPRYTWYTPRHIVPFGQALIGGAHASGSFSPEASGLSGSNSFVMVLGAGIDVPLNQRFSLRAFQADYYLTHFSNGVNDHQNNLRLGAGLAFLLGKR